MANSPKSKTLLNTQGREGIIKIGKYGGEVIKTVIKKGKIITGYPLN